MKMLSFKCNVFIHHSIQLTYKIMKNPMNIYPRFFKMFVRNKNLCNFATNKPNNMIGQM